MYRAVKSPIMAADSDDTRFSDAIDVLEDDFDYVIETLEKLDRDGRMNDALEYVNRIQADINNIVDEVTGAVSSNS